jgi:hypothetical protein
MPAWLDGYRRWAAAARCTMQAFGPSRSGSICSWVGDQCVMLCLPATYLLHAETFAPLFTSVQFLLEASCPGTLRCLCTSSALHVYGSEAGSQSWPAHHLSPPSNPNPI